MKIELSTRNFALAILTFATITAYCFATTTGTISGTIKDETTGDAIAFANVVLKETNTNTTKGTVSDESGNFTFGNVTPGTYELEVGMIGYIKHLEKKIIVKEDSKLQIDITLKASTVNLSAVEITVEKPTVIQRSISYMKQTANEIRGSHNIIAYEDNYNTEQYNYIPENEFHETVKSPLSTFSIDVDGASYSNVRRIINGGSLPPVDAVRVEEFINYFKYDYPQPTGSDPFSITTETAECPWNNSHKLISIGIQGKNIELNSLPPSNLVFLVDVSGSMMPEDKLPLLVKSLSMLTKNLRKQDRIALVVYAGNAGLVLPSVSGDKKSDILQALESLQAGGSTAGGEGIQLAYKIAKENFIPNGNNRVILATDGDFNVGVTSDGELIRMIEQKRELGIFLTVLGFGSGNLKDSKMEQLANKGNGNYSYIDNIMEGKKVLINEFGGTLFTIAKDVKLQLEFNPEFVKAYKLIGYENRMLADKDFNDDKKDAGELGSGHTVTALYEIVPTGNNDEFASIDPLKYQKTTKVNSGSNEMLTVKFRYKEPQGSTSKLIVRTLQNSNGKFDQASDNLRFASSVAAFGLILRESKFKGSADFDLVTKIARISKGVDHDGYRAEFIRLVEMAALVK